MHMQTPAAIDMKTMVLHAQASMPCQGQNRRDKPALLILHFGREMGTLGRGIGGRYDCWQSAESNSVVALAPSLGSTRGGHKSRGASRYAVDSSSLATGNGWP